MASPRVFLVVVLTSLVVAIGLNAQNDIIPTSQNQPLIYGILLGDRATIEAAETTHDPVFIPVVKRALANIEALGVAAASHHDQ